MNLSEMFIQIRGNNGDLGAIDYSNNKKCEKFYVQIESLSMSLQMEFSRLQGTSLHRLKSQKVGNNIRDIIEDGTNEIIESVFCNEKLYYPYMEYLYEELQHHFSETIDQTFQQIKDLHLTYNFNQIVWQIKDFDYQTVIRLLECLVIAYVFRRFNRRKAMPAGCYN
ncbi:MAG: hypothetical protein ACTSYI_12790 [Promethearchaeota archaeon]